MPGAHLPDWIGMAAALCVLLAVAFAQFRHIGLALLVALTPLPGSSLAVWLGLHSAGLVHLGGYFIATLLASLLSQRICEGDDFSSATFDAWKSGSAFAVGATAIGSLMLGMPFALKLDVGGIPITGASFLSCVSAIALILWARFLSFNSDFVVRANRARESRERWLDWLAFIVQPRWGRSVSGIALIFAVLGYFGGQPSISPHALKFLGSAAVIWIAIGYLTTRDIRRLLAFVLTAAVLYCLSLWISVRSSLPIGCDWLLLSLSAMPVLAVAVRSSAFAREGDSVAVANLRSLDALAATIVFYGVGAALALLVLGLISGSVLLACGIIAALIVLPSLTTAIFDLFPPGISPDAYRIR